jgi:hypothetical protein
LIFLLQDSYTYSLPSDHNKMTPSKPQSYAFAASPGMGTLAACDSFFESLENDPDEWLPEDEQTQESSNHSDEGKVEATTVNSALKRNHATVSKKEQPEASIPELQSMYVGIPDSPQPNSSKRARTEASTMEYSNMQERNHALPPSGNSQNSSTAFESTKKSQRRVYVPARSRLRKGKRSRSIKQ